MMFITIKRPTLGGRLSYISGRVSYNNIHLSYWSGRLSCLSGYVSGMINFEMKNIHVITYTANSPWPCE
jgi:hypothetical protein